MRQILISSIICLTSSTAQAQQCSTVADCSQKAMEAAYQAKLALELAVPKGAVMAFALAACPKGWEIYEAAEGRFLRGIDTKESGVDPAGVRAPGSQQSDSIRDHNHSMPDPVQSVAHAPGNKGIQGYHNGTYGHNVTDSGPVNQATARVNPDETRPKNVAVLFCVRA